MDKNFLEFWGQSFLNAARSQQQMEDVSKMLGQNISKENPIMNSILKACGWQKPENASPEEILELTKKATDAYKEFIKAYLVMFDVVSKEDYNDLLKENEGLKEKIVEQENTINNYKNQSGKDNFDQNHDQDEVVNNLSKIVKNQTQQFQELVKQVNQYYKKGSTTKKKPQV
jgi:hypothetical protein